MAVTFFGDQENSDFMFASDTLLINLLQLGTKRKVNHTQISRYRLGAAAWLLGKQGTSKDHASSRHTHTHAHTHTQTFKTFSMTSKFESES